jgi:hypothetical protein
VVGGDYNVSGLAGFLNDFFDIDGSGNIQAAMTDEDPNAFHD